MATRDENLKKINDELERMSDDELDNVAGGLMPQNGLRGIGGFSLVYNQNQQPANTESIFTGNQKARLV